VSELFLPDGVIVISQSPFKEFNRTYKVETTNPYQFPIVVLIDGETASAAEVLAGALKEGRAGKVPTLVMGQPSYGKGSIQCVIPLEKSPLDNPTAIRLTVAKLFSPSNQPYTGRGVSPHEPTDLTGDALLEEARKELLRLITKPMMPDTM
jgi:carboxyl-terminal processing protease